MGIGIDIHWQWYQPLRNKYGFVMLLGHGAVLRRRCWEVVGGFPEIVSEDLGFAIRLRERGWRGKFVEDVVCYEDFPGTVRAFRVRHMKWTRGTSQFLRREIWNLLRAKNISWPEKFDILFPTLNLPLTLLYFLFMVDANLVFPALFSVERPMTIVMGSNEIVLPIHALQEGFNAIYSTDFFLITLLTFLSPVLVFIMELWKRPFFLFRFLCHSTAVYAALGPLSAIGVVSYLVTGKAVFLVTGDKTDNAIKRRSGVSTWEKFRSSVNAFFTRTHPDQKGVQVFEVLTGAVFALACVYLVQISFFGLSLAFAMMPVMHRMEWGSDFIRKIVYVPFTLVVLGLIMSGFALLGMSTMFFSFGFHF